MKRNEDILPADYAKLLGEIKERVRLAQYEALRAVNKELVGLYWDIGRIITRRQEAGTHGDAVVKKLAIDLQAEFPGIAGFSWRNLFNMREFYLAYRAAPKLQPLAAIIGWTQNLVILQRCKPVPGDCSARLLQPLVGEISGPDPVPFSGVPKDFLSACTQLLRTCGVNE